MVKNYDYGLPILHTSDSDIIGNCYVPLSTMILRVINS